MDLTRMALVFAVVLVVFFVVSFFSGLHDVAIGVIAGGMTGLGEAMLMFPLENIKTQQQLHRSQLGETIRRTYHRYGVTGFYRGLGPVLVAAIPSQALRWGTFMAFCRARSWQAARAAGATGSLHDAVAAMTRSPSTSSVLCSGVWDSFLGGAISGVVVSLLVGIPIETLKTEAIHKLHEPHAAGTLPTVVVKERPLRLRSGGAAASVSPLSGPSSTYIYDALEAAGSDVARCDSKDSLGTATPSDGQVPQWVRFDESDMSTAPLSPWSEADVPQRRALSPPRTVWKGWVPTVLKKVLNQTVRFTMHRYALTELCRVAAAVAVTASLNRSEEPCRAVDHLLLSFAAGSLAGVSSIVVTQPLDVIKTRMQGLRSYRYHHSLHCAKLVIDEGCSALCDGIVPRALKSALGAALTFSVFPLLQHQVSVFFHGKGT